MTNPVVVARREVEGEDGPLVCTGVWVWCPACNGPHRFRIAIDSGVNNQPLWTWDGNEERPTFAPSMLVRWTMGPERTPQVCHSFLRNGVWEFLSDCTHHMAGEQVPMVPVPDWLMGSRESR